MLLIGYHGHGCIVLEPGGVDFPGDDLKGEIGGVVDGQITMCRLDCPFGAVGEQAGVCPGEGSCHTPIAGLTGDTGEELPVGVEDVVKEQVGDV